MNRRGFLQKMLLGGAAFNILPGAGRIWKAVRPVPTLIAIETEYRCVMIPPSPETTLRSIRTTYELVDGVWKHVSDVETDLVDEAAPYEHLSLCYDPNAMVIIENIT